MDWTYRFPWRSEVAFWVAEHLPGRVKAALAVDTLLWLRAQEEAWEWIDYRDPTDGMVSVSADVLTAVRLETVRRRLFEDDLGAARVPSFRASNDR